MELQDTSAYINDNNDEFAKMKADFEKVTDWSEKEWRMMAGKPIIRAEEPDMYEEDEEFIYEQLYDMNGELLWR